MQISHQTLTLTVPNQSCMQISSNHMCAIDHQCIERRETQNCSVPCFYAPPIGNLTLCCTMLLKFRTKAHPAGFQSRNWGRKLHATVDCTYPCRFQILCVIKNTHQPCLLSTNASYVQLTGKFPAIAPDCSTAQRLIKSKVTCQLCHLKFTKVQE